MKEFCSVQVLIDNPGNGKVFFRTPSGNNQVDLSSEQITKIIEALPEEAKASIEQHFASSRVGLRGSFGVEVLSD